MDQSHWVQDQGEAQSFNHSIINLNHQSQSSIILPFSISRRDGELVLWRIFASLSMDLKPYQKAWENYHLNNGDYGTDKFSQENE